MKTIFLRVLEAEDKEAALFGAIHAPDSANGQQRFEVDPQGFSSVPRSPFAYWASERLRKHFVELPPLESEGRVARQGLCTNNDFRWIRLGWEGDFRDGGDAFLIPFAKGGAFSPFYAAIFLAVRWGKDGRWIKEWKTDQLRQERITANNSKCWNEGRYFHPGITWSLRTQGGLSLRAMPKGCIFGHKGPVAFVNNDNTDELLALLALTNSRAFNALVEMQMTFGSYEVGVLQRTPVSLRGAWFPVELARLARDAWSLIRSFDTCNEASHAFTLPALMQVAGIEYQARAATWSEHVRTVEAKLAKIQTDIDERCFVLYGINEADRRAITDGFGIPGSESRSQDGGSDVEDDADDADEITASTDTAVLTARFLSWLVGVAFGRFDKRLATGERAIPPEPEPFDPLPSRSPGMWPEGEPRDGVPPEILVDDPGHDHDLAAHAANAAANTGCSPPEDLRQWLAHEFFPLHIKMYSKSRRKAPIYWQLATASASYSVWLYLHAFTKDTLYQVQNDYLALKVAHEDRRLESLRRELGANPRATEREALTTQESLVEELRAFLDEVKRVAPLWNPNLDDGVVINFAPLWRLVPHHKPWQKELKGTWDSLCAGDYDWAHLAMHLWPERVVPKCATDRSLAIAHGLESEFWIEGSDGKWTARKTPVKSIDELVRERSSPAVKAALKSLLDAPSASGTGRTRGRRAASSPADEGGSR